MKQHLITLTSALLLSAAAYAQPTVWANCGAAGGSAVTRTWDGGGADENWSTSANWNPDGVPDCNDNVVFNNTSSKVCRITSGVTVRDITMNSTYGGRLVIGNSGALTAEDIVVTGSELIANSNSGMLKANTINVSDNGYAALNHAEIFGAFTVGSAGYIVFNSYGSLDAGSFNMGNHASFRAPGDYLLNPAAKVIVRGSFTRNKVSTFDHNEGLFEFLTAGNIDFNLSSGTGQNNGRTVFHNLVMNATGASDNFQIASNDSIVVANRLTITDGEFRGGGGSAGWVIVEDTLQYNGIGDGGSLATFLVRGAKTCDLFLSAEDLVGGASTLHISNNAVIRKGSASSINSRFVWNLMDGANVSFGDAVDVTQKRNLTVAASATLNLPAANTFSLENGNLSVAGTLVPGSGTFAFTGSASSTYDLIGGTKEFYNVIINKGTAGTTDPGNLEPLENSNGGDVMRVKNDLTFEEADWRQGNTTSIIEVEGDWIVTSNNTNNTGTDNGMIVRFVGNGNSTIESNGKLNGNCDIQINKDASSNTVTVTGSLQDIGNEAAQITITKGKLAFDGTKNATLRCSDEPGLIVSADGQLVAPDDDELTLAGSWDMDNSASFDAQSGTLKLSSTTNSDKFDQNNSTITLNNVNFASATRWHWGANAGANSDKLYVKGNLNITNVGARIRYVTVEIEGNFTTISTTSTPSEFDGVIFKGSANQTLTCGDQDELGIGGGITINKTGGAVTLGSNLRLNKLELTAGNLLSSTYLLTVTGNSAIVGGSSSSFVDGKLRRVTSTTLASGLTFPIGKGSAYRPVRITNTGSTNSWDAEYFAADPTSAFGATVNAPLDAVSSTEYWTIVRNTGTTNTTVGLSTNGSSFIDADTRVARWNSGSTSWDNFGPGTGAASGFVTSSSTVSTAATYNFTLGVDNPSPISLVKGEQVSGLEIATGKSQQQAEPAVAQQAIAFNVFPNPVVETLHFSLSGADKGSVVLSDMSGKVIGIYNVADTRSISVRNLSAGVYFATYTNGVNRITHRVVRN